MRVKRYLKIGLPLLLILAYLAWGSTYFLVLALVSDFEVTNRSGAIVWITPLGMFHQERDGDRYILPQYAFRAPAIPAFKRGGFGLAAGETRRFFYDLSDIMISDIVVVGASGDVRVLEMPRDGYVPKSFIIPVLGELPVAPDSVSWAAREGHYAWRGWGIILSSLLPAVLFVLWLCVRRGRLRKQSCA